MMSLWVLESLITHVLRKRKLLIQIQRVILLWNKINNLKSRCIQGSTCVHVYNSCSHLPQYIYILRAYWYSLTLIGFILVNFLTKACWQLQDCRWEIRQYSRLKLTPNPGKALILSLIPLERYIFIFINASSNVLMSHFSYYQPKTEKKISSNMKISLSKTSIIDSSQKRQQLFQRWRIVEFRLQGWPTIFQCWALNVETTF